MIDINTEVEKLLGKLPYKAFFYYPEQWSKFPVLSFYDMNTVGSFDSDNEKDMIKSHVVIDIWTEEPAQGGSIAQEVEMLFTADGWWCDLNRPLPKANGVYHRTMSFGKEITV